MPYAGPQSHFRRLLVEVNGGQPTLPDTGADLFVNVLYDIEVVTVTNDRDGKPRLCAEWYSKVGEIHPVRSTTPQHFNSLPAHPSTQKNSSTPSTDQQSNTVNTPQARESSWPGSKKGFGE